MVGLDETHYPWDWKERSYDFKLFFVYFVGSIVLLLATGSLGSFAFYLVAEAVLAGILFGLAVVHRKKSGWRWPGAGWKELVKAFCYVLLGVFFFGSPALRFSVWDPQIFPWFAPTGGIVSFWVLWSLRFVSMSEHHFALHCGDQAPRGTEQPAARPQEVAWKRALRAVFICSHIHHIGPQECLPDSV